MQIYSKKVVAPIYDLQRVEEIELYYAEDKRFEIAIFDSKKKQVFSTFEDKINFKKSFYHFTFFCSLVYNLQQSVKTFNRDIQTIGILI